MYSVYLHAVGTLSQHVVRSIATMGIEIDNLLPSLCVERMLHEDELSWSLQQRVHVGGREFSVSGVLRFQPSYRCCVPCMSWSSRRRR